MPVIRLLLVLLAALVAGGCANHIKDSSAVIWDRVEGTDDLKVEDIRLDGAVATIKLRFTCQRRQFAITNVYETPWRGWDELYEIPVGLVGLVPGILYYVVTEVGSLGAINDDASTAPLSWACAGLNPALPVENGTWNFMAPDRYRIREKGGSRRPQEGSTPEPYDAAVSIDKGRVELRWAEPRGRAGKAVRLRAGEELAIPINLLEAAPALTNERATEVRLRVAVDWKKTGDPVEKKVQFAIPAELSARLWKARAAAKTLARAGKKGNAAAEKELRELGFDREIEMLKARR